MRSRGLVHAVLLAGLFVRGGAVADEVPVLLRDVNQLPRHFRIRIDDAVATGGKLFLRLERPETGEELAVVDGTTGALEVMDLNPGEAGSFPFQLATFGSSKVLMNAQKADHGRELWVSDGTVAGTQEIELVPGPSGGSPDGIVDFGAGSALFTASDAGGREPWVTDGTTASRFEDLLPGPVGSGASDFARAGPGVVFSAYSVAEGVEPWFLAFGFSSVDVAPMAASSLPSSFTLVEALSNTIFFAAASSPSNRELWKTDGTQVGTGLVAEIEPGVVGSNPQRLRVVNGILVFRARTSASGAELWRSDGTGPGTTIVEDAYLGPRDGIPGITDALIGDTLLVFPARYPEAGLEPTVSNGTSFVRLADVFPGVGSGWVEDSGESMPVVATATRAFMPLDDGTHGWELWRTDGTAEGTDLVADLVPGLGSSRAQPIAAEGDTLYVAAYGAGTYGIWKVVGDGAPTLLADLAAGGTDDAVVEAETVGDRVFFSAFDGEAGRELWVSDGTSAGTRLVADTIPGPNGLRPVFLAALGNRVLFNGFDAAHGRELWASDGTAAGTVLVRDIEAGDQGSFPQFLVQLGSRVVFFAEATGVGTEPWASDGTAAGTTLLRDVRPGSPSGVLGETGDPVVSGDLAYFPAFDPEQGLWVTDGTPAGTTKLLGDATTLPLPPFVPFGARGALFATQDGDGSELWISDGTATGTHQVVDLVLGPDASSPSRITVAGSRAFFVASTPATGSALWVTDGTGANTTLVKEIVDGPDGVLFGELVALGDRVVFTADETVDTAFVFELWVSDGTPAGTQKLAGICPAGENCDPGEFFAFDGAVFFRFDDRVHGHELWRTDGTVAGTALVADTAPGAASFTFDKGRVAFLGGKIFLQGCEAEHGCEPWIYDYDQCIADPAKLAPGGCGCGVPDVDADGSGVLDCRIPDELRARIAALVALIEPLAKPKTKAERKALRAKLQEVGAAFDVVTAYLDAHTASFTGLEAPRAKAGKAVRKLSRSRKKLKGPRARALERIGVLRDAIVG